MSNDPPNPFPALALIRQELTSKPIENIESVVTSTLNGLFQDSEVQTGQTVGICVGSRKIASIGKVTAAIISVLKDRGLKPVIIPAMGSHGGATPEGQIQVLESLGILAACPDTPALASMDAEQVGSLDNGVPVYFSSQALSVDHLLVVNRIKPHTKFTAPIQSGLCKMLCVGLGKQKGAANIHQAGVSHGFGIIEDSARLIIDKAPSIMGVALLEDGCGQLAKVEALGGDRLIEGEKELLKEAEAMMAKIPFDNLDVLIVDRIGKDISGIGMDSNVTGRHRDLSGDFFLPPNPKRIFVRDLSPGSGGNANGIGLADFTTSRLVKAMDLKKTFINSITAISPEKAAIPLHFESDRETLEACLATTGLEDWKTARIVRIHSTSSLKNMQVSQALEEEVRHLPGVKCITEFKPMAFDAQGNLGSLDDAMAFAKYL